MYRQTEEKFGKTFDTIVMLQATCALRDAGYVKIAVRLFEASKSEFQMSCFQFYWTNPWWTFQRRQYEMPDPGEL